MRSKQVFVSPPTPAADAPETSQQTPLEARRPGILTRKRSLNKTNAGVASSASQAMPSPRRTQAILPAKSVGNANAASRRAIVSLQQTGSCKEGVSRRDSQALGSAKSSSRERTAEVGQTLYMTTQSSLAETLKPGEPTTTTVLIPVMLVSSDGGKFGEAQKTVVVHVEQVKDDAENVNGEHEEEAIVNLGGISNASTHLDGETAAVSHDGTSTSAGVVVAGEMFFDGQHVAKTSGVAVSPLGRPTLATPVCRWYDDRLFVDNLQCLLCGQSMAAPRLAEHLPAVHGYRLPEVGRAAFLKYIRTKKVPIAIMPGRARMSGREGVGACPHCPQYFLKRLDLLAHLHEKHGQEFVLFDYEFESSSQFEKWLEFVTVEFMTGYSRYRTNVNAAGIRSQMYLCRMESKPVCKATTYKTDRRARNRAKTTYCTAHLQVRFLEGGRLHVKGSPTHINHPVDLFNAYRSLDDVPFDALPGYVNINSKASAAMHARTIEFCEKVLVRTQNLYELLHASPAPTDCNITRQLHGKLQLLSVMLAGYKFRAITIHEEPSAEGLIIQ
ncbi:hypothetical protein BIW11_13100 [Tropilaelaps mercedesae]|uniref:C2H2-type domain-containing protein n=1 Tax=Tropilaelaps mercedesae TaxID=418985 RepID=A0A1V9X3R8_9ACAR|nr:hypothetical protein BIW11_13100 [Tropilaelaps mercedesae]